MPLPPFFIKIDTIQPSQLYLNTRKIKAVKRKYGKIIPENIAPVPIKKLNGHTILTDGHTRAYILWKYGYKKIKAIWEDEDLDWELYQICVDWCKNEGITKISDLQNRIIGNKSYQIKWIRRCEIMSLKLEKLRKEKK